MGKFLLSFKRKGTVTPEHPEPPITPPLSDLVALGILPKQISEFTNADIGTEVSIPYTDAGGVISGPIVFEVVGVNHHINSEHQQTITLMTKNIIRYAAFDAKESGPEESLENIDFIDRPGYGNNRWGVSNIRQWLNSSGEANSWWTAQHEYDASPTADRVVNSKGAYADEPGFLAGFSNEVIQHLTEITNTTALYSKEGTSETTVDKVFLPSYTEMFGVTNNGIYEGSYLSLKFPNNNARKKTDLLGIYWLRSPRYEYCQRVRCVYDDGADNYADAYDSSYGITPIIVIH